VPRLLKSYPIPPITPTNHSSRLPLTLLVLSLLTLAWSAYHPLEWMTWLLEVSPAIAAIILLICTRRGFPLTPLLYILIFLHAIVLIIGGHYTYAQVPIGNWFRDHFGLSRNHYDRLGHFMQGFVPAIAAREVLIRCSPVTRGRWLPFFVLCICMTVSALYELVEWGVSVIVGGTASNAFLGTQGDVWDTQKDMAFCLVGAWAALVALSRLHDRQLRLLVTSSRGG